MSARTPNSNSRRAGKHVVLIGLGNIGSALNEMLARTEAVTRLTLVDQDIYELGNLFGQAIQPADVGRPKAEVQAERVRRLRPDLAVEAWHAALEDVPLGCLRADVILTGLDSKRSRQQVNQRVWRLGVPWVDAGVLADGRLARVTVYLPGHDRPCLECAWDVKEYHTLEVKRPCQAESNAAPTAAPAFLGSLAAALQMTECEKILRGDWPAVAVGKQITLAAAAHRLHETKLRRNPRCRFDHTSCRVLPLRCRARTASLGELLRELRRKSAGSGPLKFSVEGKLFERRLRCACGQEKAVFCLEGRMAAGQRACPRCGRPMDAIGFAMLPEVSDDALLPDEGSRPLAELGLERGDVLFVKNSAGLKAFELAA